MLTLILAVFSPFDTVRPVKYWAGILREAIKPFLTAPVATYVTSRATTTTMQTTVLIIFAVLLGSLPAGVLPTAEYLSESFLIFASICLMLFS